IVERHLAGPLPDEYAGADAHRAAISDDHAWMRRRARSRAVAPDDGIASERADPSVIAGDRAAVALAGLGRRGRHPEREQGGGQRPCGRMPADHGTSTSSPLFGFGLLARRIGPAQGGRQYNTDIAAARIAHAGAELDRLDPAAQHGEFVDRLGALVALRANPGGEPV